jgi:hypothetical protein
VGAEPWYCDREDVQTALDVREAAHNSVQLDRAIDSASRSIEGLLKRKLYPVTATRYFDWPNRDYAAAWRLWLDENELISVTTLTAGGTAIAAADYFLEPVNSGPPYRWIDLDLASTASFTNQSTHQRAISIVGLFGYSNNQLPAGTLSEALDASETAVDVSDASLVGVGSLLTVDSERMLVTGRSALDTGQNLASNMTAVKNDQTVDVASGAALHVGEILIIENERMKVIEITGNNATVIRGYDGTTLAAHTAPLDVYALRTLTVTRGALGTTAATHDTAAAVTKWEVPGTVKALCVAEAINVHAQETSAYGRRTGSDEAERDSGGTENSSGMGLPDMRYQAKTRYGRKFRKRAV